MVEGQVILELKRSRGDRHCVRFITEGPRFSGDNSLLAIAGYDGDQITLVDGASFKTFDGPPIVFGSRPFQGIFKTINGYTVIINYDHACVLGVGPNGDKYFRTKMLLKIFDGWIPPRFCPYSGTIVKFNDGYSSDFNTIYMWNLGSAVEEETMSTPPPTEMEVEQTNLLDRTSQPNTSTLSAGSTTTSTETEVKPKNLG